MRKKINTNVIIAIALILGLATWIWLQPNGTQNEIVLTEGQRDGPLLVQKIYPDRVDGLNFRVPAFARDAGHPVTLHVGESVADGCTTTLTLLKIEGTKATFSKKVDNRQDCPICLSENTYIDTPKGYVPIKDLQKGMTVWTVDTTGSRNIGIILETTRREVPSTHTMIHLTLNDGRELFASPGHPLADGRAIDSIVEGDNVDGASAVKVQWIPYGGKATYDILPSGGSGLYWANGILVKSTLAK